MTKVRNVRPFRVGVVPCDCGSNRWRTLAKGIAYLCRSCGGVRDAIAGGMVPAHRRKRFLAGAATIRSGLRA